MSDFTLSSFSFDLAKGVTVPKTEKVKSVTFSTSESQEFTRTITFFQPISCKKALSKVESFMSKRADFSYFLEVKLGYFDKDDLESDYGPSIPKSIKSEFENGRISRSYFLDRRIRIREFKIDESRDLRIVTSV